MSRKIFAFIDRGFANNISMELIHSELIKLLNTRFTVIYLNEHPNANYDYLFIESIEGLFNHYLKFHNNFKKIIKSDKKFIIQVKHDRKSHNSKWSGTYYELLNKIDANTLIFYHLSEYSQDLYEEKFKSSKHIRIRHPNYFNLPNNVSKDDSRKFLGIKKNQEVFLFFGTPRSYHEVLWLKNSFKNIKCPNKILIANRNMVVGNFFQRQHLKIIFKFTSRVKFYNKKTENEFIQHYLKASDFAFLPRFTDSILNSGLFYLYSSFKLPVIIPQNSVLQKVLKNYNAITVNNFNFQNKKEYLIKANDNYKIIAQSFYNPRKIAFEIFNGLGKFL